MPNWVRNIVKMRGIGDLPLYSEYSEEEKKFNTVSEYFDFQKLVPMPEALNLTAGSVENVAMEAAKTLITDLMNSTPFPALHPGTGSAMSQDSLEKRLKDCGITLEEAQEPGLKYIENVFRYGYTTWFGWRCEYWGTKWNSADLDRIDGDTIAFNTAWASPDPVINALSQRYPECVIEHWWADEDAGQNTGYSRIQNGDAETLSLPDGSPYALEIYVRCRGMDERLERDETGRLRIREWNSEAEQTV